MCIVIIAFAVSSQARVWTDKTGAFQAEAELVAYDGKVAKLKFDTGQIVAIPLDKLSDTDIAYLKKTYPDGKQEAAPSKPKPARPAGKPGAISVEVVGIALVKHAAAATLGSDETGPYAPGTHVRIVLSDPQRIMVGLDSEKSKIAAFTDDKGTNLAASTDGATGAVGELALDVATDGKSGVLELHQPQIPGAKATKIRVKGELHVICGLGAGAETVKVPLNLEIGLGL